MTLCAFGQWLQDRLDAAKALYEHLRDCPACTTPIINDEGEPRFFFCNDYYVAARRVKAVEQKVIA